jgi:hypothetical protein
MNLNNAKENRFRDDKKIFEKDRFSENKSRFSDSFDMSYSDLFMDAMSNAPVEQHNFTTLFNPVTREDRDQSFMGQGSSAISFDLAISEEDGEGFSPSYTSDALVKQLQNNPAENNMSFSIEQGSDKLNVEALISNGCLRCAIKPSNESLGRKLKKSKQEIEKDLGRRMRLAVAISIDSQLD